MKRLVDQETNVKEERSPDSTNLVLPGNRTIAKIVLSWDLFYAEGSLM